MDSEEARVLYISSELTYNDIAKRYGVSETYVARVAKRDGWRDQRKKFRKDVVEEALSRIQERGAQKLEELTRTSDRVCSLMDRIAADKKQFYRWMGRDGEVILKKADTRAMRDFVSAFSEMIRVVRDLYDLPGVLEERREKREERKLQLLEKREGSATDNQAGIVILPQVLTQVEEGIEV